MAKENSLVGQTAFEKYGWKIPEQMIFQAVRAGEHPFRRWIRRTKEAILPPFPLSARPDTFLGGLAVSVTRDRRYAGAEAVEGLIREWKALATYHERIRLKGPLEIA